MRKPMRKKRFDEGGGVREGRNENIGDDVRARAMRFVESGGKREEPEEAPAPKRTAARSAAKRAEPMAPVGRGARSDAGGSPVYHYQSSKVNAAASDTKKTPTKEISVSREEFEKSPYSKPENLLGMTAALGGAGLGAYKAYKAYKAMQERKAANDVMRAAGARAAQKLNMARDAAAREAAAKEAAEREAADTARAAARAPRSLDEDNPKSVLGDFLNRGGAVKKMAFGGYVNSVSKRADGIATKGKTKGRYL
jgi:hypothetical protein